MELQLKNVEEPRYHLGGDFFCDKDGTLCYGAQTYVKHLVETYKQLFDELPIEVHMPMDKDDKPELDDSPLLGPDGIKRFQTLIGAVQWLITLTQVRARQSRQSHRVMSMIGRLMRDSETAGWIFKFQPYYTVTSMQY